jgi:hypothetical protein
MTFPGFFDHGAPHNIGARIHLTGQRGGYLFSIAQAEVITGCDKNETAGSTSEIDIKRWRTPALPDNRFVRVPGADFRFPVKDNGKAPVAEKYPEILHATFDKTWLGHDGHKTPYHAKNNFISLSICHGNGFIRIPLSVLLIVDDNN